MGSQILPPSPVRHRLALFGTISSATGLLLAAVYQFHSAAEGANNQDDHLSNMTAKQSSQNSDSSMSKLGICFMAASVGVATVGGFLAYRLYLSYKKKQEHVDADSREPYASEIARGANTLEENNNIIRATLT